MVLKNIHITPNAFNQTIYVAQGDIGSTIALQKFMEVRNLISFTNIAIDKAQKEADLVAKFCLYRSAILDCNACYDYILQIIYFGFDFCSRVDSKENYHKQISEDCRLMIRTKEDNQLVKSPFAEKIEELKNTNPIIKDFFRKFKKFRGSLMSSDISIMDWANNIKHQGGFIVEELLDKKKLARISSHNEDGIIFDTAYIFPATTFPEIERRLFRQNEIIVDYLTYLHEAIFGPDTSKIDVGVSNKLFSAEGYNKEELKGNTYLQSFEPQE